MISEFFFWNINIAIAFLTNFNKSPLGIDYIFPKLVSGYLCGLFSPWFLYCCHKRFACYSPNIPLHFMLLCLCSCSFLKSELPIPTFTSSGNNTHTSKLSTAVWSKSSWTPLCSPFYSIITTVSKRMVLQRCPK